MYKLHKIKYAIWLVSMVMLVCVFDSCCGPKATGGQGGVDSSDRNAMPIPTAAPVVPTVLVKKERLNCELVLPGQLLAYQNVPIHAKVEGYISWIGVDRGWIVHRGQPMITIVAPELDAKEKEAESKYSAALAAYHQAESTYESTISRKIEAAAKLDADDLTYKRLAEAAKTPGAVAKNEVDLGEKSVEGDRAKVESLKSEILAASNLVNSQKENVAAAYKAVDSLKAMQSYLHIAAPFDGVITERNVHQGSIVAVDATRNALPLVRIQERSLLRLVVAVPEAAVSEIKLGTKIPFTVPAFLGKTFTGTIARPGFALEHDTRTMPVEMDVPNVHGPLEPGMFATVYWKVSRPYDTLFVPESAATSDLKGTFVVRIKDNIAERVPVIRGQQMGKLQEIVGDLNPGDSVAIKATDELKTGTHVKATLASLDQINSAMKHLGAGGE